MLSVLPLTLFFYSGCASTQTERGIKWEPWVGELTGMVNANLNMSFSRIEEEKDVYLIKGNFEGDIESYYSGTGSGKMRAKIQGKVKDGICNVQIRGFAIVTDGSVSMDGKMIGTLSKTQAFGTWTITARDDERYDFSGEWTAKKIDPKSPEN
jgi:hypothetical protein